MNADRMGVGRDLDPGEGLHAFLGERALNGAGRTSHSDESGRMSEGRMAHGHGMMTKVQQKTRDRASAVYREGDG